MDELAQTNALNENLFIDDLIEMARKKDKELKKFVDENLFPKKSSLSIESINKNIETLKTMNATQQVLVIGRADHFKDSNDPSKFFPVIIALFGLVISLYNILSLFTDIMIFSIFATVIVIAYLSILLRRIFSLYPTAIYFHSLVSNIKYEISTDVLT